jgi:hypothetical protein
MANGPTQRKKKNGKRNGGNCKKRNDKGVKEQREAANEQRISEQAKALSQVQCGPVGALLTDEARAMAVKRLKLSDKKLALLLVKTINPAEVFTEQEKAILAGKSRDWMRKERRHGDGGKQ